MSKPSDRGRTLHCAALAFALLIMPLALCAHEEIPGAGAQNFTRILDAKEGKYRVDLMYSPSLPTAGEPANIDIELKRLLATPDPLLGSEVPVTEAPEGSLLSEKTRAVVVPSLPVHSEGEAGAYGVAEYKFPQSGSFLLHFVIHTQTGETLPIDFPITVQANASAFFRLWVNIALGILILGLTGMQLWKVRARGGDAGEMVRPAAIGLVTLVVVVFAMDRFILGAVLDLRKPRLPPAAEKVVTANEDGTYTIPASAQQQLGISVAEAKQVSLGQTVNAFGTVEARPDLTAIVQAPLWGRIEFSKGPLAVGDRVKKGQPLVDVILELNALERGTMQEKDVDIKGALARAKQRRDAARLEYDRAKALHAKNPAYEADEAWAKQLFDEAQAQYNEIVKQDTQYQATMKFRDPRHTPVTSPVNGVITTIDFVPGELNQTTEYRKLFTIVDPSQVFVRAQVYVSDVTRLKDGEAVRVLPAIASGQPIAGKIRWIGDTIDSVNRTVPVLVDVPNEGQTFAIGSFARVEFQQPRKVLAVPEQAVVDEGTMRWVYVARQEGTFAPVQVELGVKQDGWWQVLSGISEGDQVIAKGAAVLGSMPKPPAAAELTTSAPAVATTASPATELTQASAASKP